MNRKYLLVVLLTFLFTGAVAQLFSLSPKQVEKLKGRKLVVLLPEEQAFFLTKFRKDPAKLQQYKTFISQTSELLQSVFLKYWTVSSEILFKKESEVSFSGSDTTTFFVRYLLNNKVFDFTPGRNTHAIRRQVFKEAVYGILEFTFSEKHKSGSFLNWFVPASYPFEGDLIAAVSQLNYFLVIKLEKPSFNQKEYEEIVEDRNTRLTRKTLLIDSAQVEKQFGTYKFIDDEYPFNFKLTSIEEITSAIRSKDSVYAYVSVLPHYDAVRRGGSFEGTSGGGMDKFSETLYFTHLVVDCSNFEIIGIGTGLEPVVNRRALKHYIKDIEKKSDTINLENQTK